MIKSKTPFNYKSFNQHLKETIFLNLGNENFGIQDLASELGVSRSHLYFRVKRNFNKSVKEYIRDLRLGEAMRLLNETDHTASEISFMVGFSSPSYFNKCFNEKYGYPPGVVKQLKSKNSKKMSFENYDIATGHISKAINHSQFLKSRKQQVVLGISGFIAVIILITLIWRLYPEKKIAKMEKSAAVLPFNYLGADPSKEYLADGIMDAITDHLSKIEGLRVTPRTSVEQYRYATKTASIIGEELDVSYLIEGSFLIQSNKVRLTIKLVSTVDEDYVWSEEYNRDWRDIFSAQSEVALAIANKVKAEITPLEKEIIETVPTSSLTAYDFYMRARNDHKKYLNNKGRPNSYTIFEDAIRNYNLALEYDSTYAEVYAGLGLLYYDKSFKYLESDITYMDTVMYYRNQAMLYDDKSGGGHLLQGLYYIHVRGDINKALIEYDLAIKYAPNNHRAYFEKAYINLWLLGRYKDALKIIDQAVKKFRGMELEELYWALMRPYMEIGFYDLSRKFLQEQFKLKNDTALYYFWLGFIELSSGNFDKSIEYLKTGKKDSSNLALIVVYQLAGKDQQKNRLAYGMAKEGKEPLGNDLHRFGYAIWKMGNHKLAWEYFNNQIDKCLQSIEMKSEYALRKNAYYDLAATYAFLGKKEKAFEALENFKNKHCHPNYMIELLKHDPLLDSIRDDPRFDEIVNFVENRYQHEHEKVKAWLEEEGII